MMKKSSLWVAIALMMAMTTVGCSKDDDTITNVSQPDVETPADPEKPAESEEPQVPNPEDLLLTRSELDMVQQSNDFAFNLFREVTAEYGFVSPRGCIPPEDYDLRVAIGNNILSPISIIYALGMLNNGATGETQQQINKVLGFADTGAEGINAFCRKMLSRAVCLDPDTKLNIANNIYFNSSKGLTLNPVFLQLAKENYEAEPDIRDFHDGLTMDVINQWCSDHTEKMIEKVLDEDSFNPSIVSYLLNAIYFKGNWVTKFEEENTVEEPFGEAADFGQYGDLRPIVPMMHQTGSYLYWENDLCQAVMLPYGNESFVINILLPREGKRIYDVLETLTASSWTEQYVWRGESAIVDLKLPRFEADTDLNLKGIMSRLGMPKAFTVAAEFPNFCDTETYIDLMKQVAKIKVNESGTEAAAVTIIGMAESAGPEPAPRHVTFHATRPFLYVIRDVTSGAILFIGQYTGIES